MSLNKLTIGTHNGVFHTDEVIAIAFLKIEEPRREVEVIRTRDMNTLSECDFLVDVGGEYDGQTKFDHHQWNYESKFYGKSSAGLVYDFLIDNKGWTEQFTSFIEHVDARDTRSSRKPYMTWDFRTNSLVKVKVCKYDPLNPHDELCNYIAKCNTLEPMSQEQDDMFNVVLELVSDYLLDMLDIVDSVWEEKVMDYSEIIELGNKTAKIKNNEFKRRSELVVTDGLVNYGEWYPTWSKDLVDGVFVTNGDRDGEFKVMVDTNYLKIISCNDNVFTHASGFICIIKPAFYSECMITVAENDELVDIHFDMNLLMNKKDNK